MATLLVSHPVFAEHQVGAGHPERPARLSAIADALSAPPFDALVREPAEPAEIATIERVHPSAQVNMIRQATPESGLHAVDADTILSPRSFEAALYAAGAACQAVDAVVDGRVASAFCAVRPPGHHAETARAMGFCLFNNAAIAAHHARDRHGLTRIAVVDWDVHHGNGTQEIAWNDPDLLYASTHQMPLYPGTGGAGETGVGNIFNAPLPPGADGTAFREAFERVVLPALARFTPELILISAGFDAHRRDPLANLGLTEDDFAWATEQLMAVAQASARGRIVSLLEGGYDLQALADSTAAHVAALMRS